VQPRRKLLTRGVSCRPGGCPAAYECMTMIRWVNLTEYVRRPARSVRPQAEHARSQRVVPHCARALRAVHGCRICLANSIAVMPL